MSLTNLPWTMLLLGLTALAAVLFLLQRLRVRYREQTVITTLFWKQALEEARARVLVRKFKHLLAYLFVLLIASLLWLGFADPQIEDADGRDHVVLLDGSANMGRGTRFADAVARVKQRVAALPRERRRVILCGGTPRAVLQRGESAHLLDARLRDFVPEACPATIESTLRAMLPPRDATFFVAGDAPFSPTLRETLPENATVTRITEPPSPGENAGITAIGIGRSTSGAWEKVDVLCEVTGSGDPQLEITGTNVQPQSTRTKTANRTRIVLTDIDANGGVLTLKIRDGGELTADDTAQIRLPSRKRIRIALEASLEATLGPVLRADPAVELTQDAPDVAVRRGIQPGVPTLALVPIASQEEAILVYHERDRSSHDVLMSSFGTLGLAEIDAMDVAEQSGRQIALGAAPADTRAIGVWEPLVTPRFNFVQSRSFPVFVAQAVRWLAGVEQEPSFVAAGEPVRGTTTAFRTANDTVYDPVGTDFIPPHAGVFRDNTGVTLAASLVSRSTTAPAVTQAEDPIDSEGRGLDLGLWIAGLVLVLLLVEWFLCRTGRMP